MPSRTLRPPRLARAALALALAVAAGATAQRAPIGPERQPVDVAPGVFVSVKGQFTQDGFLARSIAVAEDETPSIRGRLSAVDAAQGLLRIGSLEARLDDRSDVKGESDEDIELATLRPGQTVKISFETRDPSGPLVVDKVRIRAASGDHARVEAPIESVLPAGSAQARLLVLGLTVVADSETTWEGLRAPAPRRDLDDEDRRPGAGLRIGKAGHLSGEIVGEIGRARDYDLTAQLDDDLDQARLRADVEWTLTPRKHVAAEAELTLVRDWILKDEAGGKADGLDLRLGETWLRLSGVMSRHGSVEVGRLKWDDERDWWFRRNMDSLRLHFEWERWAVAATVSQQLVDPEFDLMSARHVLLEGRWIPSDRHRIAAYVLDRADWHRWASGGQRGFEPRHYGLHAEGEGDRLWSYWVDAAIVRGSDDGDRLRGHAFDVGAMLAWEAKVEPSFVLSYAMGSGDEDPLDSTRDEFRQTGLHENNGKWNGVTNFHYYGEVLRPELSNLHVATVGFGLRLPDEWSVDVAFHDYRLDEIAFELTDSDAGDGRRLNLLSKDVGDALDIIVGYEGLSHWEFELNLGWFDPGEGWLGPTDSATTAYCKAKYIF